MDFARGRVLPFMGLGRISVLASEATLFAAIALDWTTVQEELGFLNKFLGYELKSAERYRRFVSLVMVRASTVTNGNLRQILSDTLRTSDVMADFDGAAVILMSETNSAGALAAIERYKAKGGSYDDLRFSVVTYPSDGGGPDGMISTAFRRLQKASAANPGTIIMTG